MANVIGIDLGTTNSAMAIIDELGRPKIIHNKEGKNVTPSCVMIRGGERIVGERARRAAVAQEKNVAMFIKRHMCEPEWFFIDADGNEHRPEELSSIILRKLKQDAEHSLGKEISKAVITVPAYFQDMERNRTRQAGEMAGFEVLRIINEPTAAAIAYGLDQVGNELKVLVYDLGGGTFDVTIIQIKGTDIDVITSTGDRFLGGVDFDEVLTQHFAKQFKNKYGVDPLADPQTYQAFRDTAEGAKIDLSVDTETYIALSAAGNTLNMELKREDFEKLISHYIDRTRDLTEQALKDARLTWTDIDKVLLVGGSTRIPCVQEMLRNLSEKEPESGINPDEVVAIGAAVIAASEAGEIVRNSKGEALPSVKIKDVTAHSLGVIALDTVRNKEINSIIIPKDTPIPAEVKKMFSTVEDYQTSVVITILQGEDEEPQYCTVIGEKDGYVLADIPPKPKDQVQIEVTMQYDRENTVHLTAKELSSGKQLNLQIKNPFLIDSSEAQMIADRVRQLNIN